MAPSTPPQTPGTEHAAPRTALSTQPAAPSTASALSTPHFALAAAAIIVAVLFRSWFFLHYDESYFDSDQAIVGLMAKHLVEGRAKPLFFYGQEYMLAVEAWLMAPVFAVLGPSVFALRLTMILLNLVTALTLWWLLIREARLSPWFAALAASPFALAPFITSAHLVEAQGGNIEPFLWVLVIWMLRQRPVPLGIVLGIAFLNREFTIYAVPALLLVQVVAERGRLAALARRWLISGAIFVLTIWMVNALKPHADLLGPGTAGLRPNIAVTNTVTGLLGRIRVERSALAGRFTALLTEHLPQAFGLYPFRPSQINIGSFAHVGWPELTPLLLLIALLVLVWLPLDIARTRSFEGAAFAAYLALVAAQAAIVYPLSRDLTMFTFRYGLLTLLLPVAMAALALQAWRPLILRAGAAMGLSLLASAAALDHATVLRTAMVEPPPERLAPLAEHLEARGITVARAGYWRAYELSFRTSERVKVASTDIQRIREYQDLADRAGSAVVYIETEPCERRQELEEFAGWHLCR